MKKRDLEKRLSDLEWWFDSHGGSHDHWTNGKIIESVPRHREINENLAKKIIKTAKNTRQIVRENNMELEGKVWKDGKFWLVEVPSLNVMTQGKTKKEALFMIEDAITGLINSYFKRESEKFEILVIDYKEFIGITSTNTQILMAFSLKRQREMSGSTIQEVAERLGSRSPNSYAQYEKGKIRISLEKYEQLLQAANPIHHPMLRVI